MFSRHVSLRCGLALLRRELRPPTCRAVRPLPLPSPIHRLALARFSNASPSPSVAQSKDVKTVKRVIPERTTPSPATAAPVDEQEPDVSSLPPEERGRYKKFTIPNVLCVARIALTPYIGHLVVTQQFTPAFGLFVVAGLTDMLDGQIARRVPGQKSLLGSVLDPVADKLLVSTMFVTLSYAGLLPVAVTGVVILRDVCLITGGFVKRYQSLVRERIPISLSVFFSPRVSSMQVVPTMMSKLNTVLQLGLVASALASPVLQFGDMANQGVQGLCWLTAFTTIYSGLQYASGRAFKKIK